MKKFLLLGLVVLPGLSSANVYNYATYTAMTTGIPGSMAGQLVVSPTLTVNVSYSGNVVADSQINNQGTYYYTAYNGGHNYYINSQVSNAPSRTDIIALAGQTTGLVNNVITFSSPVTNPIMDIVSLGSPAQISNWDFNTPFTILSQGPGYWGSGSMWNPSGNRLTGMEGDGVIQFTGTYTQISFLASPYEYWGGFNVGVMAVPEPATFGALGLGVLCLLRRRKRA